MAYGVFGVTTYGVPAYIPFNVVLWDTGVSGSGDGNTRPTEGKMFPRGK
jgi:hypothetical protein